MVQVFPAIVKIFVMVFGRTMDSHQTFLNDLVAAPNIRKVNSKENCDVIVAFVPIVSRAGTDIEAALNKIPENRDVVLVVLHHTFEPESYVPDSRQSANRSNVFTVDCLFHEDKGLLRCASNEEALKKVKKHLGVQDSSPEAVCIPCSPSREGTVGRRCHRNKKIWVGVSIAALIIIVIIIVCAVTV